MAARAVLVQVRPARWPNHELVRYVTSRFTDFSGGLVAGCAGGLFSYLYLTSGQSRGDVAKYDNYSDHYRQSSAEQSVDNRARQCQ